ncbi:MAG: hypothetical protein KGI38_08045 [Thaumarchaeota archaeon]|nr:hypothetical protein [Nitrososphaerota archaeon]
MVGKGKGELEKKPVFEGLPEELAEFLSKDTYSLLVKGESGTGKTLLALTILKALMPIDNLLYLSTRTSPLQLVENYPWTEEIFGVPNTPVGGGTKENEGWETLVDARLDEPNVVFERITNVLMDRQAPTVVIDSWESLSDTLGSEALRTNIRVLQTWRERAGARFIFVGEDPASTAIDFMVEGVVVLKERIADGRRLREVVLSKLHGVKINRPSYFFTLQEGTFTSFPGYSPEDLAFRNPLPVRLDRPFRRSASRFPTGYSPLDSELDGGYQAKSTALIELDRRLDPRVGLIFLSRTVQDWLASGDNVFLQRVKGVDARYLNQYARSFGSGTKGKVALFGKGTAGIGHRGGPETWKGRATKGAKTLLVVDDSGPAVSTEKLTLPDGVDRADLTIVLGRSGEVREETAEKAGVHLKVIEVGGTIFVESDHPWSAMYAVIPGVTSGNPTMRLEPVV